MVTRSLIFIAVITGTAVAQMCQYSPPSFQGLDYNRYIGSWYLIQHGPIHVNETYRVHCVVDTSTPTDTNLVYNWTWHAENIEGGDLDKTGITVLPNPDHQAQNYNFHDNTVFDVRIVATDYVNWAIEYYCHPTFHERFMVRSRTTALLPPVLNVLDNMLASFGVDIRQFVNVDHNNCTTA